MMGSPIMIPEKVQNEDTPIPLDMDSILDPHVEIQRRQSESGYSSDILRFVMEELRIKLLHGNSCTEFEKHLENASKIASSLCIKIY